MAIGGIHWQDGIYLFILYLAEVVSTPPLIRAILSVDYRL